MVNPHHTRQRWVSHIRFFFATLLVISLFSIFLYFIGTRLEHPDLTPEKPSSAEITRQDLAIESARIAAAAKHLGFAAAAKNAAGWEETLGGIWVPWPNGAPAGYANPELDLTAHSSDSAALIAQMHQFAADLTDRGIQFANGSQMVLLASEVLNTADLVAEASGIAGSSPEISLATIASLINKPSTVVDLDSAKQVLEAHTAQLPPDQLLQRQINLENIALIDAVINAALAGDLADQRSSFIPPTVELGEAQSVLVNTLSSLASNQQEQGAQVQEKATAADKSAVTKASANIQLAMIIAQLQRSF